MMQSEERVHIALAMLERGQQLMEQRLNESSRDVGAQNACRDIRVKIEALRWVLGERDDRFFLPGGG